jgi:hypothetical protein
MTQRQRVLAYLIHQDGICVSDLPVELSYTLRNRVSELRRNVYRLIRQPMQQAMAL